jgi:hypothetical protein
MGRRTLLAVAGLAAMTFAAAEVRAADLAVTPQGKILAGAPLRLNCDNGRIYPIRPRAVTEIGELVTGYIETAPRRAHHFRLFPMGNGYRYGGHGFWFDGIRGEAVLFVDSRQTNCTVEYDV